jgi:hypothetical protein
MKDHYSYTQISNYLQCPLKYKYRYVDGWRERDDKASLIFGRVFQRAVDAHFLGVEAVEFFTFQWSSFKTVALEYPNGDSGKECWNRVRSSYVASGTISGSESRMQEQIFRSGSTVL